MDYNLIFVTIFFAASIYYYYVLLGKRANLDREIKQAPEPAGRLPIIGHLRLISRSKIPFHHLLAKWADEYGPVFNIYIGKDVHVLVSRWEEAKEVFTDNDKCLISRPVNATSLILTYNNTMIGSAPFGENWRAMRKVASLYILSNARADILRNTWESEIRDGVKELYRRCTRNGAQKQGVVDLGDWFKELMVNVMLRLGVGVRNFTYSGEHSEAQVEAFRTVNKKIVALSNGFSFTDVIHGLEWFDFQGRKKSMKKVAKELEEIMQAWVNEHSRMKVSGRIKAKEDQDFLDILLELGDKGQLPKFCDTNTCIKAAVQEYILDGMQTVSTALTWAVPAAINHADALKKAQEELDRVVGRNRLVEDSDSSKLLYLLAIMKESMRITPTNPLLVPRLAMEDCTIGGYHVAKGTTLMVNAWKLMKDPRVWPDPYEFKPERFLTTHAHMDVRGQHFQLIPFSSGRRSCPGASFVLRIVPLVLAMLFQAFDLASPTGQPIDMTEESGQTLTPANKMDILVTPRLSPDLYA